MESSLLSASAAAPPNNNKNPSSSSSTLFKHSFPHIQSQKFHGTSSWRNGGGGVLGRSIPSGSNSADPLRRIHFNWE
ncbi:hypothetical protein AMTR_s00062p00177660 [Amborella trichopoda]|uniref:Uncharacterized protein n=1 Tax=Amborella trichopoda TaxID=13333 RepID=U5DGW5_AMBTC|nr:hypothetical protein AMTR_s00062p00177660 [Amborella trichopoda]